MLFPHLADVLSLFLKAPQLKTAPTGRFAGLTEEKAVAETLKVGTATPRRNRRRPTDPGVADIIQLTRTTFGFFAQAAVAEARGRCRLARENWALLGKARWTEKLQFESNCAHRAHNSSEISPWRAGRPAEDRCRAAREDWSLLGNTPLAEAFSHLATNRDRRSRGPAAPPIGWLRCRSALESWILLRQLPPCG